MAEEKRSVTRRGFGKALAQAGGVLGIMPPINRPPGAPPTGAGPLLQVAIQEVTETVRLIGMGDPASPR